MNTERIQQRLGVETSKNSVNTDTFLKINLDGEQRLLPPDEINHVVNAGDRFNVERQRSTYYRIIGTINPIISNALFDLSDSYMADKYTWKGFNYRDPVSGDYRFLDTSYPKDQSLLDKEDVTYSTAIENFLKEKDGWFGYFDPDITKAALCLFYDMEPKRERFSFVVDKSPYHMTPNQAPVKNWELTITYPYTANTTHSMVNGGLLIAEIQPAIVATRNMTAFGMPCLHNLVTGDSVRITGTTGYDGDYVVVRTGLDNGDLQGYYFVIDKPYVAGGISLTSRIQRLFGGTPSKYYFRIFKKVKTRNVPVIETDDYETYPLAFSENVFSDSISQFVFNEDIDVSDLKDNLGRPVSELYLTTIKTNSNGLFGSVSSGIETPFLPILTTSNTNTWLQQIPTINRIHNGGTTPFISSVPLETGLSISSTGDLFYGDLVEYNTNEVKETKLAHVSHRFNTLSREAGATINYVSTIGANPVLTPINLGPRQEGYIYQAHHLIKIREYSAYVEQGDNFTDGIPPYAVDLGDGRYLWRDILDIGFNESSDKTLDYPFLNGCHYMYDNYCFTVRRQDPYDNWDLFWGNFPADPIGDRMTDKYTTNTTDDVC
jgi:hypothetical protein